MEITLLPQNSLRIKGKQAAFIVDPASSVNLKTTADVAILFNPNPVISIKGVENLHLVVQGPGEYEVGGAKVSTKKLGEDLASEIRIDNLNVYVVKDETLAEFHEKMQEHDIVVVFAKSTIDEAALSSLTPKVVVLYGEKAEEIAKAFGKEVQTTSKYQTTAEKLPGEMEVVVLQ